MDGPNLVHNILYAIGGIIALILGVLFFLNQIASLFGFGPPPG